MPKDFDRCISGGGRVRTKTLGKGGGGRKYLRICYDSAGKSHAGYVHHMKKKAAVKSLASKKKKQ
jgi:hypothetical protein